MGSRESAASSLATIARTVWNQSLSLFETLHSNSEIARTHLEIRDDGLIFIKNPTRFTEANDSANTALLNARAVSVNGRRMRECELNKIASLAKLWIPLSRTLVIAAIRVNANIIRNEPQLSVSMGEAWQPTYNPKPFSEGGLQILKPEALL